MVRCFCFLLLFSTAFLYSMDDVRQLRGPEQGKSVERTIDPNDGEILLSCVVSKIEYAKVPSVGVGKKKVSAKVLVKRHIDEDDAQSTSSTSSIVPLTSETSLSRVVQQ